MANTLIVPDRSGDTRTIWNPDNADETQVARDTYTKLKAKGYGAFQVNADGSPGKRLDEFDPEVGKMIMVPRFAGG